MAYRIKGSIVEVLPQGSTFTKWKVYLRKGKKVTESIETCKPLMPNEALRYFGASAVIGLG